MKEDSTSLNSPVLEPVDFKGTKKTFGLSLFLVLPLSITYESIHHLQMNWIIFALAFFYFLLVLASYLPALIIARNFLSFLFLGGTIFAALSTAYIINKAGSLSFTWNAGGDAQAFQSGKITSSGWFLLIKLHGPYLLITTTIMLLVRNLKLQRK